MSDFMTDISFLGLSCSARDNVHLLLVKKDEDEDNTKIMLLS